MRKKTLSGFEAKRFHTSRYHSFAYGHPDIEKNSQAGNTSRGGRRGANVPVRGRAGAGLLQPPAECVNLWKKRVEKAQLFFS